MEDTFRFNENFKIGFKPKEFYDELVKAQQVLQSDESFSDLENNILKQVDEDNSDFINNFQEIKKFRQYYTEQLVYEYLKRISLDNQSENQQLKKISEEWFKPFEVKKKSSKSSDTSIEHLKYSLSLVLSNIKIENPLINDILSYSTIPGIFSYFLTDIDNIQYISNLDMLASTYFKLPQNESTNYKLIIIYLKGVFRMPMFLNFLHTVIYDIFTPYLFNEKQLFQKEIPSIYNKIIEKVDRYKSDCPQIIKLIINKLYINCKINNENNYDKNNDENNENKDEYYDFCVSIFKDCLFEPLQKDPSIFMCSDCPSYELNTSFLQSNNNNINENIVKNRLFTTFFNMVFTKSDEFDKFVLGFIKHISNSEENFSIKMNLAMSYSYFYSFDIKLIESVNINYDSVIEEFKKSVENNDFSLYYYNNIYKASSDYKQINIDTNMQTSFEYELLELLKTAPILKPRSNVPEVTILDIIKNYLINKNDPLQVGIEVYRFNVLKEKWKNAQHTFPTNKRDLQSYFNDILNKRKRNLKVNEIKQQLKEKGEFGLRIKLSQVAFDNCKHCLIHFIVKNFIFKILPDPKHVNFFFPRTKFIIQNPEQYYKNNLLIIFSNIYNCNNRILNNFYTIEELEDFKLTIAGFYLSCNLKYYNFIFMKKKLSEFDSIFNNIISNNIEKIVLSIIQIKPMVYDYTFGSSITFFTEDILRIRNAFDANVDPHKKISLIQNCINHAIKKVEALLNDESDLKYFIDLLLLYANPKNLLSNISFMITYEFKKNYLNSISPYFTHFIELIWSDKELFEKSNESSENLFELYNVENKNLFIDKKPIRILIISNSSMKVSDLLKIIIPHSSLNWSNLDDGNQVEFNVKSKKNYVNCVFKVDDPQNKLNPNEIDVLISFFDAKKEPSRSKEISDLANDYRIKKIAICNNSKNYKRLNYNIYKSVYMHVFEFSNDKLTKI